VTPGAVLRFVTSTLSIPNCFAEGSVLVIGPVACWIEVNGGMGLAFMAKLKGPRGLLGMIVKLLEVVSSYIPRARCGM
jgi:hypothetical protein